MERITAPAQLAARRLSFESNITTARNEITNLFHSLYSLDLFDLSYGDCFEAHRCYEPIGCAGARYW